jgi:hypothetical protein
VIHYICERRPMTTEKTQKLIITLVPILWYVGWGVGLSFAWGAAVGWAAAIPISIGAGMVTLMLAAGVVEWWQWFNEEEDE